MIKFYNFKLKSKRFLYENGIWEFSKDLGTNIHRRFMSNTQLFSTAFSFFFMLGYYSSADAQCVQSVYNLSPSATVAANTVSPNGGSLNLVYTLTSGPAIAGIGTSFNVSMGYTDLNNTATGADNRWDNIAVFGTRVVLLPVTNGTATGSIYANLPTNNRQQELITAPNGSDRFFSTRTAGGAVDLLGNFSLTFGNYPSLPAGVTIVSDALSLLNNGNLSANGNGYNQGGFWLKPTGQTDISTDTGGGTNAFPIAIGTTVPYKYSAFSNGSTYPDNTNLRGVGITGSVTFCSASDLSVTKTASSLTPTIGQQVTFTIVASNAGPGAATGVTVNDQIPAGYTLISATPSTGTWSSPHWNIGNLASGASATMTVTATVNANGPYANTATITGNQPDSNPGNNTDTETPIPTPAPAPAIALQKTGVLSGDGNTITYTFRVRNTGNVPLTSVNVTDAKLTPTAVTLLATTLAPGAETTGTATYTVTAAEKTAGQVQNAATASGTPPTGPAVTDVSGITTNDDLPTIIIVENRCDITPSIIRK
jgi:uncharacterized repeat protein (TIGR01451 family)